MFDLGWDEMAVIAVVALVVLGPKELPNALRTVSGLMKQARKLAGEFQSGVNEIIREAELEDAKKAIATLNKNAIGDAIEKHLDSDGEIKAALQKPVDEPVKAAIGDAAVPAIAQIEAHADAAAAGDIAATAVTSESEVNPAVAAYGPGGSATRLPEIEEAPTVTASMASAAVEGDLSSTPIEGDHHASLHQAAADSFGKSGDAATKTATDKTDQEKSKIS